MKANFPKDDLPIYSYAQAMTSNGSFRPLNNPSMNMKLKNQMQGWSFNTPKTYSSYKFQTKNLGSAKILGAFVYSKEVSLLTRLNNSEHDTTWYEHDTKK